MVVRRAAMVGRMTGPSSTTNPGTIDLGTIGQDRADPELRHPFWSRLHHRWVLAAGMVVLLFTTATAAAAPPLPFAQLVLTTEARQFTVDGSTLYVVDGGRRAPAATAYDLADGRQRWSTPLPDDQLERAFIRVAEGFLVINRYGERPERFHVLDAADGSLRWSGEGNARTAGNDLLVVASDRPDDEAEIVLHDLATGRERWRLPDVGRHPQVVPGEPYLVAQTSERLGTYDPDGRRLASVPLEMGTHGASFGLVVGSRVLVHRGELSDSTLTAYQLPDLARAWSVDIPRESWFNRCGSLVCLHRNDRGPRALDPASGEEVWSADWLVTDDSPTTVHVRPAPGQDDHLVMVNDHGGGRQTQWLVSAETGEPLLELSDWKLLAGLWAGLPSPTRPSEGRLVTRSEGDDAWVGQLRSDMSGIDLVGILPGAGEVCAVGAGSVLCLPENPASTGGAITVQVWRIRG